MKPNVIGFFDETTYTASYIVADPKTRHCVVIDSVLDYDPASGRTNTESADQIIARVRADELTVDWTLETHVHADHLTAAPYLKEKLGGKVAIGSHVRDVQAIFGKVFNVEPAFAADGSQFDRLLDDGDTLNIGSLALRAMHTPGHTPACITFVIGDCAFVGDTLFMPDYGTARTDFPGGDATTLFQSIQKILTLPPETRLFMCHDYKAPGRTNYQFETTVAQEKASNVHVHDGITQEEFVRFREKRDATLAMPKLILPSVQVNMRAGHLPLPEDNGTRYLKTPINVL